MWSTVATAFKISLQHLSILQLLLGAAFFSCLVLAFYLLLKNQLVFAIKEIRPHFKSAAVLAMLNPVLYYLLLLTAYDLLPAQIAQSINYTWAITLTLLSVPILGHRIDRFDAVAITLGYIGVLCIVFAGKVITTELSVLGIILALVSTVIWALYWLKGLNDARDPIIRLFHSFLLSLPVLLLLDLTLESTSVFQTLNWQAWLCMAYVGLFEMGIAFIFWQLAMQQTEDTSRIAPLIFLSPFASLFIINHFLDEQLHWLTFVGLALILAGISYQQFNKSQKT